MFSGIRDFLRIGATTPDPRPVTVQHRKEREERPRQSAQSVQESDDLMFSISAIRALLTADPLPPDIAAALAPGEKEELLAQLSALEAQGIHTLALSEEASLLDSIRQAMPR